MKQLLSKQFVCHNSSESVALTTNGDDSPTVSNGNGVTATQSCVTLVYEKTLKVGEEPKTIEFSYLIEQTL